MGKKEIKQAMYFKGTLPEFVEKYNEMQKVNASQLFQCTDEQGMSTGKYECVMYYTTWVDTDKSPETKQVLDEMEAKMYDDSNNNNNQQQQQQQVQPQKQEQSEKEEIKVVL